MTKYLWIADHLSFIGILRKTLEYDSGVKFCFWTQRIIERLRNRS